MMHAKACIAIRYNIGGNPVIIGKTISWGNIKKPNWRGDYGIAVIN